MVAPAANWAVETLRDLLIQEVKLLSGVEGQVEDVGRELQAVRDFLKDADKWPDMYDSAIVGRRVSELINLATRADDVLEKYAVEVASKIEAKNLKEMLERFTCILCECLARHEIGKEIGGIKSRMAQLTRDLESRRNTSRVECNDDQRLQRQTYSHGIPDHVVEIKSKNHIVSLMQDPLSSYRVFSICGMGGLGKTTLAQQIYRHKDEQFCFEARAWVCITQKLQAKVIFRDIWRQLLDREINEGKEEAELVRELYRIQTEKKCLVVLDDIWEVDHWNILKKAFPLAKSNSKILLTTRERRVVEIGGYVHPLDFLTVDQSWDLLRKIAFPNHQSQDTSAQFKDIGRQFARKCGCLPLAVSVIGGILRGQQNLVGWDKVLHDMDSYLKHGNGDVAKDKRVEEVLNLSYNVLPYYLKLCFLYLGFFPKDMDIEVEDVYLIWMAEGLISSYDKGRNETLRDVAERYLNELASKCMVQVKLMTDEYTLKSLKSYRLHDLVRDLCLLHVTEEKFLKDSQGKNQRLAINLGDDSARIVEQFKNAKLRSLLLYGKRGCYDITNIWENLLSNDLLKSLKVLVLENCRFQNKKFPHIMRKLVMLKHLSIKHSLVLEVPEFICELRCLLSLDLRALQSLDLRAEEYMTLPYSINKMGRLRHLILYPCRVKVVDGGTLKLEDAKVTRLEDGTQRLEDGKIMRFEGGRLISLDGLSELETFIGFNSQVFVTKHLLELTNLRRLGGYVTDIESLFLVVDHMTKLKDQLREASLEIHVDDLTSEKDSLVVNSLMHCPLHNLSIDGRLRRLPTWDQPQLLQNLHTLILDGSEFLEDPMKALQHLLTLRSLWFGVDSFVGTEMVCGSQGFPQLKNLRLRGLRNLVGWRVERGGMPNLLDLLIYNCPTLEMIPEGMIFMASITKLTIRVMPSSFVQRLKRGGDDYPKISHIPFLDLDD